MASPDFWDDATASAEDMKEVKSLKAVIAKFDNLNQSDINTLFSHINSYPRKSLNKKTPYQCVFDEPAFGKEFLDVIGIYKVNCDDVNLTPALLKKIKN